jgi:hypothetical protein
MGEECTTQCVATKLLVIGIVIVLARLYTTWDIWVVIGALLIIKAVLLYVMPVCGCQTKAAKDSKKKK